MTANVEDTKSFHWQSSIKLKNRDGKKKLTPTHCSSNHTTLEANFVDPEAFETSPDNTAVFSVCKKKKKKLEANCILLAQK